VKLGIYTAFFCVLFTFYGLPIHIMRDWFMTTRSFLKRLNALIRYRQALKDMDQYPDATAEDLGREDTCIICREEMRPWDPNDVGQVERSRPKKLPCGHILHFGCLKSWLERQQVCPTCRSPVVRDNQGAAQNGEAMVFRLGLNFPNGQNQQQGQPPVNGQAPGAAAAAGQAPAGGHNGARNNRNGVRMFNLGPLRLGFAQGGVQDIQDMAQRLANPDDGAPPVATPAPQQQIQPQQLQGDGHPTLDNSLDNMRNQLLEFNRRIQQDMQTLQSTAQEVQVLNVLVQELARLRQMQQYAQAQQQPQQQQTPPQAAQPQAGQAPGTPAVQGQHTPAASHPQWPPAAPQAPVHLPPYFPQQVIPFGAIPPPMPGFPFHVPNARPAAATVTRHSATNYGSAIPAGSPELPEGVVIPPGWSLLPLQRMDGGVPADAVPLNPQGPQLNDMLQSLGSSGARSARPQNTSTAATQGSEATERSQDAPPTTDATSSDPNTFSQMPSLASEPQVNAPTPIMPNWGGSNQLLGGNAAGAVGLQGSHTSDSSTSIPRDEGRSSSMVAEAQPTPSDVGSTSQNGSAGLDKGKGKAVTVEDAEDDDKADA
jgi:E3 ubiquitin-protein ligase synoviolin